MNHLLEHHVCALWEEGVWGPHAGARAKLLDFLQTDPTTRWLLRSAELECAKQQDAPTRFIWLGRS